MTSRVKPFNYDSLLPGSGRGDTCFLTVVVIVLLVFFVWAMVSVGLHSAWFYGSDSTEYPPFGFSGHVQPTIGAFLAPANATASGAYVPCVNTSYCWGTTWYAALNAAPLAAAWLAVGGDVALGYSATAPVSGGALQLVQMALARDFADGGSGRYSIGATDVASRQWDAQYGLATVGSSALGTQWTMTQGAAWHGGSVASTPSGALEVCGAGNALRLTLAYGLNAFTVQIDAAPVISYALNVTAAFMEFTLSLAAPGAHCATLTSSANLGLAAFAYLNLGAGVWADNNAAHNFTSLLLNSSTTLNHTGGAADPRPLAVYMPDYYSAQSEALLGFTQISTAVLSAWAAQGTSILIVRPFIYDPNADDPVYPAYLAQTQALITLCASLAPQCALLDFVTLWSPTVALGNDWMSTTGLEAPSSHLLSDAGHMAMATQIYAFLTAQVPLPCCA